MRSQLGGVSIVTRVTSSACGKCCCCCCGVALCRNLTPSRVHISLQFRPVDTDVSLGGTTVPDSSGPGVAHELLSVACIDLLKHACHAMPCSIRTACRDSLCISLRSTSRAQLIGAVSTSVNRVLTSPVVAVPLPGLCSTAARHGSNTVQPGKQGNCLTDNPWGRVRGRVWMCS